jgi:hypothetical protein
MVSGLDNTVNGTNRKLFGKEGDSRGCSYIFNDCTQRKQKWWTAERKIKNCDSDTSEGRYSGTCCQEKTKRDSQSQTKVPKPRKKVQTCVATLYKTDSDTSDSEFTTHESDKFTGVGDCEDGVDFTTQPLKPKDFVLLKLVTKEEVE